MSQEPSGQRLGDYEMLGVLGRGGMGKVFKVRNVISDRIEAMKVLLPDLAGQQELVERFLREIKLLAALDHPNIAALRTALTLNNQLVMVMEFVEGSTLAARLQQGPLVPAEAVHFTGQVLDALSYAHRRGIIHRDIKPANMMVTPQGLVKLMDFGIARSVEDRGLTQTGTTLGSLYYMSPEQIQSQPTDARSDLYSLGVSLYEMVTGRRPFQAGSNYELMAAHLQQAPLAPAELQPQLPAALNQVILMALAKNPAERFQSADAFRNALGSFAAGLDARPAPGEATAVLQGEPPAPAAGGSVPTSVRDAGQLPLTPVAPVEPASRTGPRPYRGFYMTLGALLVLAVLVAAGVYVPRWARTRAGGASPPVNSAPAPAGSAPTQTGSLPGATGSGPQTSAAPTPTGPGAANSVSGQASEGNGSSSSPPAAASSTNRAEGKQAHKPRQEAESSSRAATGSTGVPSRAGTQPSGSGASSDRVLPAPAPQADASSQLDELQQQMDQLAARALAAKDSVENLRKEQSAQGLNLRGDISAAEDRMGTYMDKAQAALDHQNAADAERYLGKAATEVATLEKFLSGQ